VGAGAGWEGGDHQWMMMSIVGQMKQTRAIIKILQSILICVVVTFALQHQSDEEEEEGEGPARQQRKQMRFFFFFLLPIGINVRIPDTILPLQKER
jgi:hypothetical protein